MNEFDGFWDVIDDALKKSPDFKEELLKQNFLDFGEDLLKSRVRRLQDEYAFIEDIKKLFALMPKSGQILYTKLFGLDINHLERMTLADISAQHNIEIKKLEDLKRWVVRKTFAGKETSKMLENIYNTYCLDPAEREKLKKKKTRNTKEKDNFRQ